MGGAAGSGLGSPEGGGVISDFTLMDEGLLGVGEREEQIQGKAKKDEKEAEGRNEGHRRGREGRRPGNVLLKSCQRTSAHVHPAPWLWGQREALLLQDTA